MLINAIRSALWMLFLVIFTFVLGIIFLPIALVSNRLCKFISVYWSKTLIKSLSYICGINHEVKGLGHYQEAKKYAVNNEGPVIVISKHQSAWETLFFTAYLGIPKFVLKRELSFIPLFGLYTILNKMIFIDRSSGPIAIRKIIRSIQNNEDNEDNSRFIVIFPEGTRVAPGETKKFQSGAVAIMKNFPKAAILPIAVNSGICWPKGSFIKKPGTITVEFLNLHVNYKNHEKEEFLHIENEINAAMYKLEH